MSFLTEMLGGFSPVDTPRAQQHYEDIYQLPQPRHEASFTHEAIAAAAGFAAMHAYESHLRATGQPVSHGTMKEILAAIAAAEVDKLAETKGLDWMDRHKAKKMAEHQAHHLAAQRYGEGATGWEYAQAAGGPRDVYNFQGGPPYSGGYPGQSYGGYQGGGGYAGGAPGYGGGGYEGGTGGYGGYPPQNEGYYPPPPQPGYGGGGGYGGGYGGYEQPPPPGPPQGYYEGGYGQPPPPQGYYGGGEYEGERRYRREY